MEVVMEAAAMKEVVMAEVARWWQRRGSQRRRCGGDGGAAKEVVVMAAMVVVARAADMVVGRAMVDGVAVTVLGVMVAGRAVARAARSGSEGVNLPPPGTVGWRG